MQLANEPVWRKGATRRYRAPYKWMRELGLKASILEEQRDVAESLEHYAS